MKKAKTAAILWQWKALEYLVYLTTALVPLVVAKGQLFGFTSTKSFIFMALVAVMVTLYAWGKYEEIKKEGSVLRITWLHGLLALFAIALGISAIFGVDPHTSWFGTFREGTGLVYIYAFIVWSMLIGVLVRRNDSFLIQFLGVTFATGVLAALLVAFKSSTIGNSSFEGAYLLFISCIGLGLFIYSRALWKRVVIGAGMLTVLLSPVLFNAGIWKGEVSILTALKNPTLFAGEANGAVLGTAVAFFIAFGLFLVRSAKSYKRIAGAVLCIAVVGSAAIAGWQMMTPGTSVNSAFIKQASPTRFVYWDIAAAGFLASPITGYGWGNYDRVFQEYFDPVIFSPGYAVEPGVQDPHNAIWSYAATTGALGVIAYTLLIGGIFIALYAASRSGDRMHRVFSIVLAASMVGYFLQNMFVFDTPVSYLLLFSIIGIAVGMTPVWRSAGLYRRYSALHGALAVLIVTGSIACIALFSMLPAKESAAWFDRLTQSTGSVETSPQSISLMGNANDTSSIAGKFYASTKDTIDTEKEKTFYTKKYQLLASDIVYDLEREKNNYKPYLVKGIIENGLVSLGGKADPALIASAKESLERAQTLNPRTPEVYFNLAQTAMYERNFDSAYTSIRAGIALNPAYQQGYELSGAVIRTGAILKILPNREFEEYAQMMREIQK
ncbi:MAG TPA: O-antigen ligase family protein [Candidatus Paceibacterota bacterium]